MIFCDAKASHVLRYFNPAPKATGCLLFWIFCVNVSDDLLRLRDLIYLKKSPSGRLMDVDDDDWITRYFFSGGTMPSANFFYTLIIVMFCCVSIVDHWLVNGKHYAQTSPALSHSKRRYSLSRMLLADVFKYMHTKVPSYPLLMHFKLSCSEIEDILKPLLKIED